MVFRDDDISYLTKLNEFRKVHEYFEHYKVTHTLAIITNNIEKNTELVDFINNSNFIDIQVHCHDHLDFALLSEDQIKEQLIKSKQVLAEVFDAVPSIFYPPFNSVNEKVIKAAKECGLETSYDKTSALYYVRHNGDVIQKVLNFHYFDYVDSILVGAALKIYDERKIRL